MNWEHKQKRSCLTRFHCSGWKLQHEKKWGCKQVMRMFIVKVFSYGALESEELQSSTGRREILRNPLPSVAAPCSAEGSTAEPLCVQGTQVRLKTANKPQFSLGNATTWSHLLLLTRCTPRSHSGKVQTPGELICAS